MSNLMQEKQPFERIEVSREQALEIFAENKFKAIYSYCSYSSETLHFVFLGT